MYKKAKLAEESKREAVLIKELEGILLKEGLSKNPSEKGKIRVLCLVESGNHLLSITFQTSM